MTPFLTFYTPTYKRPVALARCLASVGAQTLVAEIEQIVLPDHLGLGIVGGLYGRIPLYADACRGRYVHVLADDDALAGPDVVAQVKAFAETEGFPPVIVVRARKSGYEMPACDLNPPECGAIDMGCFILRADVWRQHAADYGPRYEGDYDHALALYRAGHRFAVLPTLFVVGDARKGKPEVAA